MSIKQAIEALEEADALLALGFNVENQIAEALQALRSMPAEPVEGADMDGERCLWARNGHARCALATPHTAVEPDESLSAEARRHAKQQFSHYYEVMRAKCDSAPQQAEGWVMVPVEIVDRFPEINPSNYDHDDACALNAWGVELVLAATPSAPTAVEPTAVEMSPEFTDTARAALLWVLWHHQGASSKVGQPIRFALGMGQHERLNEHQVSEAKRWQAAIAATPSAPTAVEPDERELFNIAWRQTWGMVDPLRPPAAGSYALGEHNGIIAALKTIRENFDHAARASKAKP